MPVLQEQKPVIEARFSAAVWSCALFGTLTFLPLPRFASVTCARYLLLGANTPWAMVWVSRVSSALLGA